jgi:hypothetical protein
MDDFTQRQQKGDSGTFPQIILTAKISLITKIVGTTIDYVHGAVEYEENIQDQSECEAQKQAAHYIRSSRGQHGRQNNGCNHHRLLRKSDE